MAKKSSIEKHLNHLQQRRYRMREDADQLQEDQPSQLPRLPEMKGICNDDPILVTDTTGLNEMLATLKDAASFAYDSEFIGESSYAPKICLIQVATMDSIWLVDPLDVTELNEFWALIADPGIETITHSGRQDWEPVVRALNQPAANIFDTQLAAGFAGWSHPMALSKMIKAMLNVTVTKGSTFTLWDRRPLSNEQLRYAADDVRYLPLLAKLLGDMLDERGVRTWFREELDDQCRLERFQFDVEQAALKMKGAGRLSKKQWPVLVQLVEWRDEQARKYDLPARSFLKDAILVNLAARRPRRDTDLRKIRDLPSPILSEYEDQLLEICSSSEKYQRPGADDLIIEELPEDKSRVDAVFSMMQLLCHGRGIDPSIVCSRSELSRFYLTLRDHGIDRARQLMICEGWRGEVAGEPLIGWMESGQCMQLNWTSKQGVQIS